MSPKTPIALFVYNRPQHTRLTVEALQRNDFALESDLFIFSDAEKTELETHAVKEIRKYIKTITGFKSVTVCERETNMGLANSIITGVTHVCDKYGRVIVLEDDLITSPFFLRYMNDALDAYANDERVASIHGYWYPIAHKMPETFFLRGASCWGWATWSRAWRLFEPDGRKLFAKLRDRSLVGLFDLDGAMAYTKMLKNQIKGRNNSWAIRWHASTFLENRLQLSPGKSLVRNTGFDGTGVHCSQSNVYDVELTTCRVTVGDIPVEESAEARAALIHYYKSIRRSIVVRIIGRLRRKFAMWVLHND